MPNKHCISAVSYGLPPGGWKSRMIPLRRVRPAKLVRLVLRGAYWDLIGVFRGHRTVMDSGKTIFLMTPPLGSPTRHRL